MFLIVFLCLIVITSTNGSENIIDYYENIINEGMQSASTYQYPTDASEYKTRNENTPKSFGTYDYVIVGGGTAGCVIASRLSEIKRWKVLLLEAGREETDFTEIPAMLMYVYTSEYNWGFNSTPSTTCCQNNNGVCPFARGRALGGTSAINGLLYSRGNRADFDKWASMGNPSWSYKNVLPFYLKSESAHIRGDENYHNTKGYLSVEHHIPTRSKTYTFINASNEIGERTVDYNGRSQLGVGFIQYNTLRGRRDSSARAFLTPAKNRKNLKILTRAYGTKVLISKTSKTANGVLFSHNNTKYYVKANKEVILSGGTLGSAQLLLLSGVGPKKQLQPLKIPIVHELAVGEKLHDHTSFYLMLILTSVVDHQPNMRDAIIEYLQAGTGRLTTSNGDEAIELLQVSTTNSTSPDIELLLSPSTNTNGGYGHVYPEALIENYVDPWNVVPMNATDIIGRLSTLVMILLHPKSTGRIYLNSNDPYQYPTIQENCLNDKKGEDVETLFNGMNDVFRLLNTSALRAIDARLLTYLPCNQYPTNSKDYWLCNFRRGGTNAFHPTSTCAMGPDPRKGAVVDNRLKVHGIKNLRVGDVSVVPFPISAHMSAPAMMIGEKLADFVKRENGIVD